MTQQDMTIRWRNKPLDRLSADELRAALVEAIGQTIARPGQGGETAQSFYATFVCGMLAGAFFCLSALALSALAG